MQSLQRGPHDEPGISHNVWHHLVLDPHGHKEERGPDSLRLDAAIPSRCLLPLLYVILNYISSTPVQVKIVQAVQA